jgi:hypothetical protein
LKDSQNYHIGVAFENVVNGPKSRLTKHFR